MKNSLNSIAYRIFEAIRSAIGDDDSIDIRQIKSDVHNERARWISRDIENKRYIQPSFIQDLGCVELEIADPADCCDISLGCSIMRTKKEIPDTIASKHGDGILRVGYINKTLTPMLYIPYSRVPYTNSGRFNKQIIYVFRVKNRLYLVSDEDNDDLKLLEYINVRGIFENPSQVKDFVSCDGDPCYTDDDEYPITRKIRLIIEQSIKQIYIPREALAPSDTSNDAKHTTTVQSTQEGAK